MNQPIPQTYNFKSIICSGSHSNITIAEINNTNEFVAIKSQPSYSRRQKHHSKHHSHHHDHHHHKGDNGPDQPPQNDFKIVNKKSNLKREAKLYKMLAGATGFPMFQNFITNGETDHLILELLGPNLLNLIKENFHSDINKTAYLSLKSVLQIADQALLRLQYLHKKGYVHGDIKPENFVIGKYQKSNQIYLIDFNLATRYVNKQNVEHVPLSDKHICQGSLIFSSINSQRGLKLSRRDDLESLGYVLVYLLHGSLPWSLATSAKNALYCKMNTSVKHLCEGLPYEFEQFINSTRCLTYSDEPDYSYYRQLFRDLFIKEGYIYDYAYDWSNNDKFKTIIYVQPSFPHTNLQPQINVFGMDSKKSVRSLSKSNIPFYDSLVHLSAHQTADIAMVKCYHHEHHSKHKQSDQAPTYSIPLDSIGNEPNIQSEGQRNSNILGELSTSSLSTQNPKRKETRAPRLVLNYQRIAKTSLKNQSSG